MISQYLFFCCRKAVLVTSVMLILLALSAGEVQAQTTGTIYGQITDSAGAALTKAAVTVQNLETNLTRTATTNAEGAYTFTLLPVGNYRIKVEAQGFKSYEKKGLELQVAANLRIDLKLEIGQVTEGVNVTGEAPLVDTANATLGTVVEERRIVDLHWNGQ